MEALITVTEPELLRRAQQGDDAALGQVARDWYARIRRWALYEVGDPVLAEDVVQEVLLRLMNNIHRYDPDRPFGPWLRAIVRNCARTEGGRQQRHAHDDLAETDLRIVPDPEHALDTERAAESAVALFGRLSGRQREVMHLCTHDGLTPAEAADVMGVAPSTARVLLFRARRFIRSALWKEAAR